MSSLKKHKIDKVFLWIVITLLGSGILVFVSASLSLLEDDPRLFRSVLFNQLILGVGLGGLVAYGLSRLHYHVIRNLSFWIFIFGLLLTVTVFIPGLGFSHGGAQRWISLGPISLQPAEFLKFSTLLYWSAWLSWIGHKRDDMRFSILPLVIGLTLIAGLLLSQPDTKSLILITLTTLSLLFISGFSWKKIAVVAVICMTGFIILASTTPYLKSRIDTFRNPNNDPTGASYQVQQSFIAIGSGGIFGRGFGKSVQKFGYLPEAQGDSIFAVLGEEMGFLGTSAVVILFIMFFLRGMRISMHAPDEFGRLFTAGVVILLTGQSFLNIASLTGVFPLTGVPLVFFSHGGTSLFITMIMIGIVFNISRYSDMSQASFIRTIPEQINPEEKKTKAKTKTNYQPSKRKI
ncbi:MAG: cell division protein FtsW [Flavobacteriaceae bacterium]|jgi:cell division protein FtsW